MVASWWQQLIEAILPAVGTIKRAAHETMVEAQQKVHEITRMVIKSTIVFLIMFGGALFLLVGFAKFLETWKGLVPGSGLMIVGGCLFVLGLFAWTMRR